MSRRLTENQIAQIIHDFSDSESEGIEDTAQENILEEVGDTSDCESIHSEHNSASEIEESDDSSDTESAEDTSSNSFTVKPVQMEQNSTTSISYSTAQHHRRAQVELPKVSSLLRPKNKYNFLAARLRFYCLGAHPVLVAVPSAQRAWDVA
ncbi:hypothetical protein EVAR_610_1 [Eumeta japonica]|uniref:Uncharacterized protein n=1 Tax=Eumeta variegata TaxID=151549 RepID=A0A4C1SDC7_EUMVA|nr:hypothetical protein EVAR_610_1 [Eumeta japonica]